MARKTAKAEEEKLVLPEWVTPEAWKAFDAMRKKIKKPMTPRAAKMIITGLEHLRAGGDEPNLVLLQSECNCWQDVYPLKPDWLRKIGKNRDGTDRAAPVAAGTGRAGRTADPSLGNF